MVGALALGTGVALSGAGPAAAGWFTRDVLGHPSVSTDLPPSPRPAGATVERIKDGDTLLLTDGRTVRLLGVDTPEKGRCWAAEATAALATLVPPGSAVTLTPDPTQAATDKYGRTLAYVEDPVTGDASYNLIRQGAGRAYVYAGNPVQRAADYQAAQGIAQNDALGIWAPGCTAY